MTLPEVGAPAPAFRLPTAQGTEVALEAYRGRRVVLWFSKGLF
ncbi:MAG: redoxin domain-containing protein [Candidatus Rokubacteria bacterium]|nr:redoxin domain-containing protein [Candidatus Rokubacteria bacterium]